MQIVNERLLKEKYSKVEKNSIECELENDSYFVLYLVGQIKHWIFLVVIFTYFYQDLNIFIHTCISLYIFQTDIHIYILLKNTINVRVSLALNRHEERWLLIN